MAKKGKDEQKAVGTEHDDVHDANAGIKENQETSEEKSDVDEGVDGIDPPPHPDVVAAMSEEEKAAEYQRLAAIGDMSDNEIRDILFPEPNDPPVGDGSIDTINDEPKDEETMAEKTFFEQAYDEAQIASISLMVGILMEAIDVEQGDAKAIAYSSRECANFDAFMKTLEGKQQNALLAYERED